MRSELSSLEQSAATQLAAVEARAAAQMAAVEARASAMWATEFERTAVAQGHAADLLAPALGDVSAQHIEAAPVRDFNLSASSFTLGP